MIRFGSLQKDYDFYVSTDPAFEKPPTAPPSDAPPEAHEAFQKAAADYLAKWKAARETSNYGSLIVEGQEPTKYVLGRVNRKIWRALMDRTELPVSSDRRIGSATAYSLLARLAVRSIPSLDMDLKHVPDPQWNNWPMAPAEIVEQLDDHDASIVGQIGQEALRRLNLTQGNDPF